MTVAGSDVELEVAERETVFEAAGRAGYWWPTVCGGMGSCRTCAVTVREGTQNCEPPSEAETEGLATLLRPGDGQLRLACQLRVTGPVTVVKRGVRPVTQVRNQAQGAKGQSHRQGTTLGEELL